jgi:predicted NUDIX family NTP pyrophosphohydrolase
MPQRSAGILLYRRIGPEPEVLLVHPGGPFWAKKDEGAWSIPKGLYEEGEDPLAAARRELQEETGCATGGEFLELGAFRQPSGKTIAVWAAEGDFDLRDFHSNVFALEWPPRSGEMREYPEADRAAWFPPDVALVKILKGQAPILQTLFARLASGAIR